MDYPGEFEQTGTLFLEEYVAANLFIIIICIIIFLIL